jgi:hypothetical protein
VGGTLWLHARRHPAAHNDKKVKNMLRHAGITAALSLLAVVTPLAACSSKAPKPGDTPSVAIAGASVIRQGGDNPPYVTMTVTTSVPDRLNSATVDQNKVAEGVILTAPAAIAPPEPGKKPGPLSPAESIDAIELAGGQAITFGPGSYGMWLSKPKKLTTGRIVTITLNMDKAGDVDIQAPVRS